MKRIYITHFDNDTFYVSGWGETQYYKYNHPKRDDIECAIAYVTDMWKHYTDYEKVDVIIEVDLPRTLDPDIRLIAELDTGNIRLKILEMRELRRTADG